MAGTALITGGGSGIGRASAIGLAEAGYTVLIVGRRPEPLQETAKLSASSLIHAFPCDVSNPDAVASFFEKIADKFPQIDLLLNAAGAAPASPLMTLETDMWHEILNANLSSAFYMSRACWLHLITAAATNPLGAKIINISSMAARDPLPGLGAYAIAKAGLNMLTLMTAREGAPYNIRAFGLAPGAVDTPMFRALVGDKNVHPEKILKPTDLAAIITAITEGTLHYASGETIYLHHGPA